MLGTNDVGSINADTYKNNLQTIINQLKAATIKKIVLSIPPYYHTTGSATASVDANQNIRIAEYQTKIDELVAENDGIVVSGDRQAFPRFEVHQDEVNVYYNSTNIHPGTS
jgi:lysophospholipase L1-like esterase